MSENMDSIQYKCPNCMAELKFNPRKQGFSCEFCDSFFTPEECQTLQAQMQQEAEQIAPLQDEFEQNNQLYICQSCGAELMTDAQTTATECIYCHNPVILKGRLTGNYRPSKIIPFQFPKEAALLAFHQRCDDLKYLPKDFTSEAQLVHMKGLYVPFWVAECYVHGFMQAECHRAHSYTSGNYEITETEIFDCVREGDIHFSGIPADGESKIDDDLMEAIEPFDYTKLVDFDMSYLSGFLSDKYDVNKQQVFPRIKNRAVNGSDHLMRTSMKGYTSVRVTRSDMNVLKTTWQYMLLPVWFMSYDYQGKRYEIAINGQTQQQAGELPINQKKLNLTCVLITVICTLIGFIIGVIKG